MIKKSEIKYINEILNDNLGLKRSPIEDFVDIDVDQIEEFKGENSFTYFPVTFNKYISGTEDSPLFEQKDYGSINIRKVNKILEVYFISLISYDSHFSMLEYY